jgi:hypothetical protein
LRGFANLSGNPFASQSIVTTGGGVAKVVNVPNLSALPPLSLYSFNALTSPGIPFLSDVNPASPITLAEIIGTKLPTDLTDVKPFARSILRGEVSNSTLPRTWSSSASYASSFDGTEINRLESSGILCGPETAGNHIQLVKGSILFAPSNDIVVGLREGKLSIPAGAILLVDSSEKGSTVFCLHQYPVRAAKIISEKRKISLTPGLVVVLTDSKGSNLDDVAPALRFVAYRNAGSDMVGSHIKAFFADFSIQSALTSVAPLRSMFNSANPTDRRRIDNILKNATILSDLDNVGRPYQRNTAQAGI